MLELFGSRKSFRPSPAELPEALQELLGEVKQEKAELEVVLERVRNGAKTVGSLNKQLTDVTKRQQEIASRVDAAEERARGLAEVGEDVSRARAQLGDLGKVQQETGAGLDRLRGDMKAMDSEIEGIRVALRDARKLRADVEAMVGPSGTVGQLGQKADEMSARLKALREEMHAAQEAQQALLKEQATRKAELDEMRSVSQRVGRDAEDAAARLTKMEATVAKLGKVQEVASRVEQQLQNLSALAEHVGQKTAALETQRETADRAAAQAARLDDLVWDLDKRLKKVTEDSKVIQKAQSRILGTQELVQRVEGQLTTLKAQAETAGRDGAAAEKRLRELRAQIDEGLRRFELERGGLNAMNAQVAGLRSALGDFEKRRAEFESSNRELAAASARADDLSARIATLGSGVTRIEEQVERVHGMRSVLERAETATKRLTERVQTLEDSKGSLDAMASEMVALRKQHDIVVDTLERLKQARAEMERSHAAQSDVRSWLGETQTRIGELRAQVDEMDAASGTIERTREMLGDLLDRTRLLDDRQHFVSSLEERLDGLGSLSASLDDRMRALEERRAAITELEEHADALNERLNEADRRFKQTAKRAEEAKKVEERLTELKGLVDASDSRVHELEAIVAKAEGRAAGVEALGEQIQAATRELESRERAVSEATAGLERAAALKQELADAIRDLEGKERRVSHAVEAAGEQATLMAQLADQVEGRVGNLRFAEKRMTQFEEKLAAFEQAEKSLGRSLQELEARHEGVDAVRTELGELFAALGRTIEDVRSITATRQEVQRARSILDDVLERTIQVDELVASVERKKKEIGDAEARMARLDATLRDVQGSLESVRGQRAMIDSVLEKAGQLAYQAKEAEALIVALKEERDLTARVVQAVQEVREEKRAG